MPIEENRSRRKHICQLQAKQEQEKPRCDAMGPISRVGNYRGRCGCNWCFTGNAREWNGGWTTVAECRPLNERQTREKAANPDEQTQWLAPQQVTLANDELVATEQAEWREDIPHIGKDSIRREGIIRQRIERDPGETAEQRASRC